MYKVIYNGNGQIEVDLPSYSAGVIIKHGEYARLELTDIDKRVIDSIRHLGLSYEKLEDVKKSEPIESEPIEEPVEEPIFQEEFVEEPTEEVSTEEVSSAQYSKDELMKKTAGDLKGILKDLGSEDFVGKSKSEMADMILEISK